MELKTLIEQENSLTIVKLIGELDIINAEEFIDTIRQMVEEGQNKFFFDLSQLENIDSSGLGGLIRILTIVRKQDGSVWMTKPQPIAFKVFEITRLDRFFNFVKSKEDVKKQMKA